MDQIQKSIIEHKLAQRKNQLDLLEKGTYAVGTVRTWNDGNKYKKIAEGKWIPVAEIASKGVQKISGGLDMTEFKAYSLQSKYWAKNKAKKEGLQVFQIADKVYLLDPAKENDSARIAILEGMGVQSPSTPKKTKNTAKEWHESYREKADSYLKLGEEEVLEELAKVEDMSSERFSGFLTSGVATHLLRSINSFALDTKERVSLSDLKASLSSKGSNMASGYDNEIPTGAYHRPEITDLSKLTEGHKLAIKVYSSNGYLLVNRFTTGKITYDSLPGLKKFAKRWVDFTTESLSLIEEKLDSTTDRQRTDVVTRGYAPRTQEELQEKILEATMNIGGTISFNTMLSTAAEWGTVLNEDKTTSIIYHIKRKSNSEGKYIAGLSSHGSEREVLFPPTAKFRVKDVIMSTHSEKYQTIDFGGDVGERKMQYSGKRVVVLEEV